MGIFFLDLFVLSSKMHGNSELLANSTNRVTIVTTAVAARVHTATVEAEVVRVAVVRGTRPIVAVGTRIDEV